MPEDAPGSGPAIPLRLRRSGPNSLGRTHLRLGEEQGVSLARLQHEG